MDPKTRAYLLSRFREYYGEKASSTVSAPHGLMEREFAFAYFDRDGMFRHIGFTNSEKLISYLVGNAPAHAYFSAAHYVEPSDEVMEGKGWKGADLVFDIDADHLDVPCRDVHDRWVCHGCGETGRGAKPTECPSCKSAKLEERVWLCEECIGQAKSEALKLVDILSSDLGFCKNDIGITYTGNRGYHVRLDLPQVHILTSGERKEVVDYVTGQGMMMEAQGSSEQSLMRTGSSPQLSGEGAGWGPRVRRAIMTALEKDGVPSEVAVNKEGISEALAKGRLGPMRGVRGKVWDELVWRAVESYGAAHVDEPVTVDIHRLIRLEGSLHGKTGFAVTRVLDLERFDPFRDAVAFRSDEEVAVRIKSSERFRVGEAYYGPFNEVEGTLPLAAGIFAICRGVAETAGDT